MKIIDISRYQGKVDYRYLYDKSTFEKIEGLIFKLSQVKYKDPTFETNYSSATKNGYKVGCYIYNKVYSTQEAIQEANFAVSALGNKPMELYVWLDMEDKSMRKLGKKKLQEIIETEASILRKAGYKVGIYCNLDWYLHVLGGTELAKKYKFWIARYPLSDTGVVKESLNPKKYDGVVMWQYSSKGKVNGISGNVDMDITFTDYFKDNVVENTATIEMTPKTSSNAKELGMIHACNFIGQELSNIEQLKKDKYKLAAKVLQTAINLDYSKRLDVDGIFGTKSKSALGAHYVKLKETQFMVTALVILLLLNGYELPLDNVPTYFDIQIEKAVKDYQQKNGYRVNGIANNEMFLKLITTV